MVWLVTVPWCQLYSPRLASSSTGSEWFLCDDVSSGSFEMMMIEQVLWVKKDAISICLLSSYLALEGSPIEPLPPPPLYRNIKTSIAQAGNLLQSIFQLEYTSNTAASHFQLIFTLFLWNSNSIYLITDIWCTSACIQWNRLYVNIVISLSFSIHIINVNTWELADGSRNGMNRRLIIAFLEFPFLSSPVWVSHVLQPNSIRLRRPFIFIWDKMLSQYSI